MKRILSTLLAVALTLSVTSSKVIDPSTVTSPKISVEQQENISDYGIGETVAPCDDSGSPAPGGDLPN